MYAEPGAGKSFMALQMCKSVIGGHPFFGKKPSRTGKAFYFALEGNKRQMHLRRQRQGWTPAEASKITFEFDLPALTKGGIDAVEEAIADVQPAALIVIDPFLIAVGPKIDVNRAEQAGELMNGLRSAVQKLGSAILIVHHSRKSSKNFPAGSLYDDAIGSRAVTAFVDVRVLIHNPPTALTAKIKVGGKDRPYEEIPAFLDEVDWNWKPAEDPLRSMIVDQLKESGSSSATSIARRSGKDRADITKELIQLLKEKKVTRQPAGREVLYELVQ